MLWIAAAIFVLVEPTPLWACASSQIQTANCPLESPRSNPPPSARISEQSPRPRLYALPAHSTQRPETAHGERPSDPEGSISRSAVTPFFVTTPEQMRELHDAVKNDRLDLVKSLLNEGYDPNVRDPDNNDKTPLHVAPSRAMERLLMTYEADPRLKDRDGNMWKLFDDGAGFEAMPGANPFTSTNID